MSQAARNCTVLFSDPPDKATPPSQDEILKGLESQKVESKVKALKDAIVALLNGEQHPRVLMYVIRYCSTHDDHQIKKLLLIYWELVEKYDAEKKMLPEMILIGNALLNDLTHPNEYIRGCMMRFLCKIKEFELLEPLKDAIIANLEHRHSFVRRNAVMAVYSMYKNFGDRLIHDAPELIERFLVKESDIGARRNAFMMLFETAQDSAVNFLMNSMDQIQKFGDGFSLVILELTRKVCRKDPTQKSRFVQCIFQLLNSPSAAVSYEAAWTLITLSSAPTAVRSAAKTYAGLLNSQSDNNIKLIILDRLEDLKKYHGKVLQEILMDILRSLNILNIEICKKVLHIAMGLISQRNIEEVVQLLKREVTKTQDRSIDKSAEYRHLLISSIHDCCVKFPHVARDVVELLIDFLDSGGAMDVILFLRDMCESYEDLREIILQKLLISFAQITSAAVYRVALWIIGEYSESASCLDDAFDALQTSLGPLPFKMELPMEKAPTPEDGVGGGPVTKSVVLADGTYATETVYDSQPVASPDDNLPSLRKLVLRGEFLLATVIASTMTKLALRAIKLHGDTSTVTKNIIAQFSQYMCGIIVYGQSSHCKWRIDEDSRQRITQCLRALACPQELPFVCEAQLVSCRESYKHLVSQKKQLESQEEAVEVPHIEVDEVINFRQLRGKKALGSTDIDIDDGADIGRAIGDGENEFSGDLRHVHQLTGFDDHVYAEAYVTVHDYDIVLEIMIINRTEHTLNNLTVELNTMGDLKLVERPQSYTLGPFVDMKLRANIKVSSTETGHIFGTIVFNSTSGAEKTYINLNDIHLDIMDYIIPSSCPDYKFRSMWAEFEWENKVAVNTDMTDLLAFLNHIAESTHMRCMTPSSALEGETNVLGANLYAKSVFGEDALVNISVEKLENEKISGYIRIRSKTQGIALSLGDRITAVQRTSTSTTGNQKNPRE